MRIGLAADHEGYELKNQIVDYLMKRNIEAIDYGAVIYNPEDDYPDFVIPLSKAVAHHQVDRGIAICGSGIGACIAANKVKNVRAGIIHDVFSAKQGVEDDDMNVICIGSKTVNLSMATQFVESFLKAHFSGLPRHERRLEKISELEEMEIL